MQRKLSEVVTRIDQSQIPGHLLDLSGRVKALATSILGDVERSNESVALANLGRRCALELERCSKLYPSSIEGVGWCARNLFEIDLILRHIMKSPENLDGWMGQVLTDERQIIEGVLGLCENKDREEAKTLRSRLKQIDEIGSRHGIKPRPPFQVKELAKASGVTKEYEALYKLFSKYIHPTAYVVNSPAQSTADSNVLDVFVVHATLYSGYTYKRLEDWVGKHRNARSSH